MSDANHDSRNEAFGISKVNDTSFLPVVFTNAFSTFDKNCRNFGTTTFDTMAICGM